MKLLQSIAKAEKKRDTMESFKRLIRLEDAYNATECNDWIELNSGFVSKDSTNIKDLLNAYRSEKKRYISPESSLSFRYTFVFRVAATEICVLDLIPYTLAWKEAKVSYQEEPYRTILRPTCSLLFDVHEKWKNNEMITPQIITFLVDLDIVKLLDHIKGKNLKGYGFCRCILSVILRIQYLYSGSSRLSSHWFNCWFSSAPVFQWCCSTPQGSPGVGCNTFLSSPHLCFIIVFICDLFISRDDPLMS